MAKDYFQFKQFRVYQNQSGMKVCTDSCILGAWAKPTDAVSILDIGTGTGLLSLMLAQNTQKPITGIEIDKNAYKQAHTNILHSPWSSQIKVINQSVQEFVDKNRERVHYDFIICNPPFFKNHLLTQNIQKQKALHDQSLSMSDLLIAVNLLLTDSGRFVVMYPEYEAQVFMKEAFKVGLFCTQRLSVYHSKNHSKAFRVIQEFEKKVPALVKDEILIIKDEHEQYHIDFEELLREYYLIF